MKCQKDQQKLNINILYFNPIDLIIYPDWTQYKNKVRLFGCVMKLMYVETKTLSLICIPQSRSFVENSLL